MASTPFCSFCPLPGCAKHHASDAIKFGTKEAWKDHMQVHLDSGGEVPEHHQRVKAFGQGTILPWLASSERTALLANLSLKICSCGMLCSVKAEKHQCRGRAAPSQPPPPPSTASSAPKTGTTAGTFPKWRIIIVCLSKVAMLDWIPPRVRVEVFKCIEYALRLIVDSPDDADAWLPLVSLTRCLLVNQTLTGRSRNAMNKEREGLILVRCRRFLAGEARELFHEALEITAERHPAKRFLPGEEEVKLGEMAVRMAAQRPAAALRVLLGEGTAAFTPENVREVESKFPQGETIPEPDLSHVQPLQLTPELVEQALSQMTTRAPGSLGLCPLILLQAVRCGETPKVLELLTSVVNIIAAGKAPVELATDLAIPLTVLRKLPSGVRPIGVPSLLDAIFTRGASIVLKKEIQEEFVPYQQALAPRGVEVVYTAASVWAEQHAPNVRARLVLIDFVNLFNSLKRARFLQKLLNRFPSLALYAYWAYKNPKKTFWQDHIIDSLEGLIQGCGFGPLICSAAEHELILEIKKMLDSGELAAFLAAYMDDLTFGCTEKLAAEIILWLQKEGPKEGCVLNLTKTLVWAPCRMIGLTPSPEDPRLPAEITRVQKEGVKLLGSPLGSAAFILDSLRNALATKVAPLADKLMNLKDPQTIMVLLARSGIPTKMNNIMRCVPTKLIAPALVEYEQILRTITATAMGESLSERVWALASLPVAMGGFGLRCPLLHAHAAHLACLATNRDQILKLYPGAAELLEQRFHSALTDFNLLLQPGHKLTLKPDLDLTQSGLSKLIDKAMLAELLAIKDDRFVALITQLQSKEANAWKRALPDRRKGLALLPALYQLAMKRNFGAKLFPADEEKENSDAPNCPFCLQKSPPKQTPLDPYGDHLCSCKKGGGVVNSHNAIRDLAAAHLHQANVPFTKESHIPMAESYKKSSTWRADIHMPNGIPSKPNKELLLDFTITNPFVKTHSKKAAKAADSATVYGEKHKHYDVGQHTPSTTNFLAISLTTLGAVGSESRPFFNHLLTQLAYQSNAPFAEVATSFWTKQSVLLQRLKTEIIYRALLTLQRTRRPSPTDIRSENPIYDLIATST
jgi:hypothetical protein